MERKVISEKFLVLGVDGMDPVLTKKYLDEGKLPNIQKFLDQGVAREDLYMLGVLPTITPPSWTTLSTGANPETHGITCFFAQSKEDLDIVLYNLDSRNCKAEHLWDVYIEEGKKALVWHWPGSAWPPTKENPNLHVVDGTNPTAINVTVALKDWEKIVYASDKIESVLYKPKAAHTTGAGCLITDLEVEDKEGFAPAVDTEGIRNIELSVDECADFMMERISFDLVNSPIKEPKGWANAPEGAKEFTVVSSSGLARRPALILNNDKGVYDKVAIYKSKKDTDPYVLLEKNGKLSDTVIEEIDVAENAMGMFEVITKDDSPTKMCSRIYKVMELAPDGSEVKLWMSSAMDIDCDTLWSPKSVYKDIVENVGYVPSVYSAGATDPVIVRELKEPSWSNYTDWQARSINYLIEKEDYDIIFSHLHNIDTHGHGYWHYCKERCPRCNNDEKEFQQFMENVYVDTDKYVGQFLHLIDKGWSIVIISDHGLIVREEDECAGMADPVGVLVPVMEGLGYTAVKRDESGNRIKEIDWENTKAINTRGNFIWINLKGRNKTGIVDPADKKKLERKIIDDLYNYKDPKTGKRVVSLAVRNKEAVLFGLSGPESGDIIFFIEEEFAKIHGDGLPTYIGYANSSLAPVFMAAGKGFKKGVKVNRVIREVDVVPTLAALGGVRVPAQTEGGPLYQMLDEDV